MSDLGKDLPQVTGEMGKPVSQTGEGDGRPPEFQKKRWGIFKRITDQATTSIGSLSDVSSVEARPYEPSEEDSFTLSTFRRIYDHSSGAAGLTDRQIQELIDAAIARLPRGQQMKLKAAALGSRLSAKTITPEISTQDLLAQVDDLIRQTNPFRLTQKVSSIVGKT